MRGGMLVLVYEDSEVCVRNLVLEYINLIKYCDVSLVLQLYNVVPIRR